MSSTELQTLPRVGMLATIRNRRGVIVSVDPFPTPEGTLHMVRVEYLDSEGVPEDTVVWEREYSASLMEPTALPTVEAGAPMPPHEYDALVRATRWSALTPFLAIDGTGGVEDLPISAPFHGAVQTDDFQLVPLLKALRMPRVSLLLADDVGLGKTVEAGLILTELLIRRRVRRVLILCPASLRRQWQHEMRDKFSLTFDRVDRPETHALHRRLGLDANPWRIFPRIIASYHYLKQPDVMEQFRSACRQPPGSAHLPWDLLIVDEAHNLSPSNFGEDSDLSRMLRAISPWFEHKLYLTATPHNGHTRCFSGLLEQLDPVRFTQTSEFSDAERSRIEEVVVRRLKREINEADSRAQPPRTRRFADRHIEPLPLFFAARERRLSRAFDAFRTALRTAIRDGTRSEQVAGSFAVEVLNKRLLSCPASFADSWYRCRQGMDSIDALVEDAEMKAVRAAAEADLDDDCEKESRGTHAARITGVWLRPIAGMLEREILGIDGALGELGLRPDGDSLTDPAEDARLDRLQELIQHRLRSGTTWKPDERLIVFTEYKRTLDYLQRRLREAYRDDGRAIRVLYGGMDEAEFETVKSAFNDPADPLRVLIATDTASEGQNFQETARYVLHFEVPWNPARLEQRNGRLDRHGQARDVTAFHFTSDDDADLKFLGHVVGKVHTIREDLGSMGEVFDAAFLRRFRALDDADQVGRDLEAAIGHRRGRAQVPHTPHEAETGTPEAERLARLRRQIDLSPTSLESTLDVALGGAPGKPVLEGPDATGRFRLRTPVAARWSAIVNDSLRVDGSSGVPGFLPSLVFDPALFVENREGRPVFRPRKGTTLLHLGHPMFRHALASFARLRFPGGHDAVPASRWTIRRGGVPTGHDGLVLLSVEELAVNQLREPFHHWVRTIRMPVRDGALQPPLPTEPPVAPEAAFGELDERSIQAAVALWDDVRPQVQGTLARLSGDLTTRLNETLRQSAGTALRRETERFRQRLAEVQRSMHENSLAKLERERDKILADLRLTLPLPELRRPIEEALRNLDDELDRRKHHYQDLYDLLQAEQERVLKRMLPLRFALRGDARVFPVAIEIRLPEVGR